MTRVLFSIYFPYYYIFENVCPQFIYLCADSVLLMEEIINYYSLNPY